MLPVRLKLPLQNVLFCVNI